MPALNNIMGRADLTDIQLPDQVIKEVIQEAPKHSVILSRAKNVHLSAKKAKQPVLATLPEAYWVNGDTGLKQTTKNAWKNINITAEELAVIVPIPDALIDDTDVPRGIPSNRFSTRRSGRRSTTPPFSASISPTPGLTPSFPQP